MKEYIDVNKIIDELSQLRGVGEWTTHITVFRSMHRHRTFPADDARKIAGKWGKWGGLAGFYLIAGEIRGIII